MKLESGNDYEQPTKGTKPARLIGMYDIGEQPNERGFKDSKGNVKGPTHQVILTWELVGKEKTKEGKNFQISQFLTVSMHKKGNLCPILITLGAPVKSKSDDWWEIDQGYHLSNLLGEPAMVEVIIDDNGKAKVNSVMAPIDGMVIGEATEKLGFLDLDADDYLDYYTKAPAWVQKMCQKSVGWAPM